MGRGETSTVEDRRPDTINVPITIGWTQTIEIKDQMDEVLPAEDFLSLLSKETTGKIVAELEKSYSDVRKCDYPILPQFLAIVYMKLKKIKYLSSLLRELKAKNGELAEKLGFKKENGTVEIPSYKNFWTFLKVRVGEGRLDALSVIAIAELDKKLRLRGIEFGKKTAHDGYVIRAHDKGAVYNGHYETTMYKGEVGFDIDLMVPFYGCATTGTDYDGSYVVPFVERLDAVKKDGRTMWLDGHYASIENFAILNHTHKVRTIMNIPKDQRVISEDGSLETIERRYQSLHEKADFVAGATLDYKLTFLMRYGRIGEVGYYYRNQYVQEYIDNQAAYEKEYHRRSAEESGNNVMKNGLVDTENASYGTGLANRNLHVKWCILAMQIVALIRVQHGRTRGLTSVENIAC